MFEHLFVDFKLGFDLDLERLAMLVTDLAELAIRGCDIDKNEVSILLLLLESLSSSVLAVGQTW